MPGLEVRLLLPRNSSRVDIYTIISLESRNLQMISTVSLNKPTLSLDKITIPLNKKDVDPRSTGSKASSSSRRESGSCARKATEKAKRHNDWAHDTQRKRQRGILSTRQGQKPVQKVENSESMASASGTSDEQDAKHAKEAEEEELAGLEEESRAGRSDPTFGFGSAVLSTDPSSPPPRSSVTRRDDSVLKKFSQPIDFDVDYDGTISENIDFDNMSDPGEGLFYKGWDGPLF